MSREKAAVRAQNIENLAWEGENESLTDLTKINDKPVFVPIFNAAFPATEGAQRVHSGQVAQVAGVWVSGIQAFDVKSASELKWDTDYFQGYEFHLDPLLPEGYQNQGGASSFVLSGPQDAQILAEAYWDQDEPYHEWRFEKTNYEPIASSPKGLEKAFLAAAPVELSGRIFMSREEALEDARILASIRDLGADVAMKDVLENARPTPAFDMQAPGKVDPAAMNADTALISAAYAAGLSSPRPLIAAAALSGAIAADDIRLQAPVSGTHGNMVHELRRASPDRTDAIIATAAGKALREKTRDPEAMVGALTKLEQVSLKTGNPGLVGMVISASENVMGARQASMSKSVEFQI